MRLTKAGQLAELLNENGLAAELIGDANVPVGPQVCIDSRQATPGALFVALVGERVDGHDYLSAAAANGAVAALVSRPVDCELTQIVTADALAALTELASWQVSHEQARGLQVLAVTGSSGKTSTKDLLAQILGSVAPTVAPVGSYNNELGNPLTAIQIDQQTKYLVSEMGARAIGDVAKLCQIVHPNIGIVLNIGNAHLGEFGSRAMIAQAKGEIIEGLPADGWAVLNGDDEYCRQMVDRTKAKLCYFSCTDQEIDAADMVVRAHNIQADELQRYGFELELAGQRYPVQLNTLGAHQVANALAAAAASYLAGVAPADIVHALNNAQAKSAWRMAITQTKANALVLNDAYNANPDSMRAGLATLASLTGARRAKHAPVRSIAILGDMLELGEQSAQIHHQIGTELANCQVDQVFAIGDYAADLVSGAQEVGVMARVCTPDQVLASIELNDGDIVLIKASRGLQLEKLAAALIEQANQE